MTEGPLTPRRHIVLSNSATTEPYTYPREVRGGSKAKTPPRDRSEHAGALKSELDRIEAGISQLRDDRTAFGVSVEAGLKLTFESSDDFDLVFKSLDRTNDEIELDCVVTRGKQTWATVVVPPGKLERLLKLIDAYATEDTKNGKPKNQTLIESIEHIRWAALEGLWTDALDALPTTTTPVWFELWLRAGKDGHRTLRTFEAEAEAMGLELGKGALHFPDRVVVLARGTSEQLARSVQLLDAIAELRLAKAVAEFFTRHLGRGEQAAWVADYARSLGHVRPTNTPAVCVLDTGVNRGHPLLEGALDSADVLTCDPTWGSHDHHGHGTEMAGLALHGDLTLVIAEPEPPTPEHILESVKLLAPDNRRPDAGMTDLDEKKTLWGNLTQQAIARIELEQPDRHRAFCLAVTTDEGRDHGVPSSWSAALDQSTSGANDDVRRLVLVSAGNVELDDWSGYPDRNDVEPVHDPGQAWNALTIGAYTERSQFDANHYPGALPISLPGTLSPSSTTSHAWDTPWPNKPDLVFEGGNGIRRSDGSGDAIDELSLLTTYYRPQTKLLVPTGETSAATAQVAHMAGTLMARYPALWPETIRALLTHSAEWTRAMHDEARERGGNRRLDYLLRRYGYGVPDLARASWSASNALTLIAEDRLTPYEKKDGGIGTKDLNLHTLPWPRDALRQLFDTQVTLRVTLSYFVEPNPARRGWKYKHRYQSHGLRFALINPGESLVDFRARVTRDAQDSEAGHPGGSDRDWLLGSNKRDRGSLHSDTWTGTAAALADRFHLAVFPVGGWWKERPQLEGWKKQARYSLVVSIRTPTTDVDIYTPIATEIGVPIEV